MNCLQEEMGILPNHWIFLKKNWIMTVDANCKTACVVDVGIMAKES